MEWTSQDHQGSSGQANQAPEGCNSAPPTTLEFESQSAATSLGYITHPVSARDHTSSDAALEGLARSEHEGDVPDAAGDSFEFERQAQENREQHVPLTAPIERGFEMNSASAARFQFPTQHAHPHPQSMDPAGTADRRSPYLPPFRAAYSMPDRSYSDSGTYGRSPSPAMHPGQHSMPEPYAHPGFVHQPGYHYVPQPNGSSSVPPNGHDMAAIPRMPPYATSDPYLRQQQSMPPPGYGHVRSAVPFPSSQQQQQQHQQQQQQQMPTALPMSAAPGSSVTPRPKSAEDNGQLVSLDRSLPPAAPPAAKPGQNQGTPCMLSPLSCPPFILANKVHPVISKLMHLLSNDRYSAYIRYVFLLA